jgi:hypothetical protein
MFIGCYRQRRRAWSTRVGSVCAVLRRSVERLGSQGAGRAANLGSVGLKHRSSMLAMCHRPEGFRRAPGSGRGHPRSACGRKLTVRGLGLWKVPEAPAHVRECRFWGECRHRRNGKSTLRGDLTVLRRRSSAQLSKLLRIVLWPSAGGAALRVLPSGLVRLSSGL